MLASAWFIASLAVPTLVFAHATPVSYEPAAALTISGFPKTITIRFSEHVEPHASSITVFAPDGAVLAGEDVVDSKDAHVFSFVAHAEQEGTYAVSWQVVSADDGHFTKGAYQFSVGRQSVVASNAPADFQVQHRSDAPQGTAIWLELLGQAVLFGCLVLLAVFQRREAIEAPFQRRLSVGMTVSFSLIFFGISWYLVAQSLGLQADRGSSLSAAFLDFSTTVAGRYSLYRLLCSAVLATIILVCRASFNGRSRVDSAALVLLGILFLLRARVSHAAASDTWPVLSVLLNALHLAAKNLWCGLLLAYLFLLAPLLRRTDDMKANVASLLTLSRVLSVCLGVGGVTGAYIVWLHLKQFQNLTTTHWGMQCLTLATMAGILLALRLYNHISSEPKPDVLEQERILPGIPLMAEALTGVFVLLLSSFLIITTPPLAVGTPWSMSADSQGVSVTLSEHQYDDSVLLVRFEEAGKPVDIERATVTLTNADRGIGPIVATLTERFVGGYTFPKDELSPPGTWTIDITGKRPSAYDAITSFTIPYPHVLTEAHRFDHDRGLNAYTIIMIGSALLLLGVAWILWLSATRRLRHLHSLPAHAALSLKVPHPWFVAVFEAFFLFFAWYVLGAHGGAFTALCAENGHLWHENVPMWNGRVTSNTAVLGCMLGAGKGQYHFADQREYEYFLRPARSGADMTLKPRVPKAGQKSDLTFALKNGDGKPVTNLSLEHDRIMHVVIVSQDQTVFSHVHPDDDSSMTPADAASGLFHISYTFPKPGRYLVAVDYTVRGQLFAYQFPVLVAGTSPMEDPVISLASERSFDGYDVSLSSDRPLVAGSLMHLRYDIRRDRQPVKDVEPYLSAAMHIAIVRSDLLRFMHTHAELPQTLWSSIFYPRNPNAKHSHVLLPQRFGPTLDAYVLFPSPGLYTLFGEFRRHGTVVTTTFSVEVH